MRRSGRPYSLTFSGSGVFNGSTAGSNNGAAVHPDAASNDPNMSPTSNMAAVQQLVDFASTLSCAKKYLGQSIPRNTCTNDWYNDLDLRFSQELPGPGAPAWTSDGMQDKLTAYVMFDNFLNMLNKNWNVQHRRQFAGLQEIAGSTGGVDANGKYIVTSFLGTTKFNNDNFINVSGSVWRIKVGLQYDF